MDADVAYADCRLDAWASWVRGGTNAWPARTLLARIIEQGVSGAAQGCAVDRMPVQVLQTDRIVARLQIDLKQTILIYYLTHASSEVKAAHLGVSRATFWRRVTRAQKAVYQGLDGETQNAYHQSSSTMSPLKIA
jgi:predicted DNA-binding protein (UPF0251 family)